MLFFTLGATPPLFAGLGSTEAGRAVSLIFPSYYAAQALCGAVVLTLIVFQRRHLRGWLPGLALVVFALGAVAFTQFFVSPAMAGISRATEPEAFARLHGWSMMANLAGFLAVAVACGFLRVTLKMES